MLDLRIIGANQLGVIGRRLKETGDKELRREVFRGINRAVRPAKDAVRQAALDELPRRGGLNRFVADAKVGASTRLSGPNPRVRLTGRKSGHDLRSIDRGRLRHPVFARSDQTREQWTWVSQSVKPGWWTEALQDQAPRVRREIVLALADVARRLGRG